jgi:adenosine deaminase CECR1
VRLKKLGIFAPRQNFLQVRDVVQSSPLGPLLARLPKGAVLHLHSNAVLPVEWLVANASYRPECYVWKGGVQ